MAALHYMVYVLKPILCIVSLIFNRFGRKWTFISTLALSSVFLAILAIVQLSIEGADEKLAVLILSLCLMGRFCNEASWAVMACLSGEIFPTVIRSLSFSICSTFSSIGGIIAPQMAFLGMSMQIMIS